MNLYQLFTRDGKEYAIMAKSSDEAIRMVGLVTDSFVSCWFIGKPSSNAIKLLF